MIKKLVNILFISIFCNSIIAVEPEIAYDSVNLYFADTLPERKEVSSIIFTEDEINRDYAIGYASFEYGLYTKSIHKLEKHFIKSKDTLTADYLYGSYINMNRIDKATAIFPYLSQNNKNKYLIKPHLVQYIYIEGGCLNNEVSIKSQTNDYNMNYNPGGYGMIEVTHNITPRLTYKHLFNYYEIPGNQKWINTENTTEILKDKTKEQHLTYAGKLQFCTPKNWIWGLSGAYIKDKFSYSKLVVSYEDYIDDYSFYNYTKRYYDDESYKEYDPTYEEEYPYEDGYNQFENDSIRGTDAIGTLSKTNKSYNNYAFELSVKKDINRFTAEIYCSYANIGNIDIFQPKIKGIAYPLQNLNFYSATTLADVLYKHSNNIIIEELLGAKITKWLWLEGAFAYGDMSNYSENDFATFYTTTNKTKYRISGNIIVPINKHFTAYAIYRYMPTESNIVDETTNNVYTIENKSQNIIGGLKCIF